jgi:hypothetical protein
MDRRGMLIKLLSFCTEEECDMFARVFRDYRAPLRLKLTAETTVKELDPSDLRQAILLVRRTIKKKSELEQAMIRTLMKE